ncbi:MAG TPA: hypothetical protein VIV35_06875, partial [Chitinophagaceae bacterium]
IYFNVAIVFLLSGFWHGANWTFVVWGAFHAFLIIGYMLYKEYVHTKTTYSGISKILSIILTFVLVCFGWIFFRAHSMAEANMIIAKILNFSVNDFELVVKGKDMMFGITATLISIVMILFLLLNDYFQDTQQRLFHNKPVADVLNSGFILFLVLSFGVFQKTSFIYFQF